MEEVKVENLEPGKDYYIQLVGRYFNRHRKSGKAIGINFIKRFTFRELRSMPNFSNMNLTLHPDNFENDELFAQFEKVVPVNPARPDNCGICHYEYYPSILPSWDNLTDEQKPNSRGGYQFFKMKKQKIEQKHALNTLMEQGNMYPPSREYTHTFLGGKTRRRRRKTNTKRRRKTNTKRRRKKTNTKYSKV